MKINKMATEQVTIEQAENEIMLMGYEIRFWKNKAMRSEQQRDHALKEKLVLELRLEKFNGITDEMIERLKLEMKRQELIDLKLRVRANVDISVWIRASQLEETIMSLDEKIKHWAAVIQPPCVDSSEDESSM